jgi:hypothetical protein
MIMENDAVYVLVSCKNWLARDLDYGKAKESVPSSKLAKLLLSSEKLYGCPQLQQAREEHRDMQQCTASDREANAEDTLPTDSKR